MELTISYDRGAIYFQLEIMFSRWVDSFPTGVFVSQVGRRFKAKCIR
mgnify:CR=1 FL=1